MTDKHNQLADAYIEPTVELSATGSDGGAQDVIICVSGCGASQVAGE
jgi:hypothetical protein